MSKLPTAKMKTRSEIGFSLLMVLALAISVNLFKTSVIDNKIYQDYANTNQFGSIEISANRGTIYDTNGNILAKSATVFKVFLDPSNFREKEQNYSKKEEIVEFITSVLDIDEETLLKKMDADNQYEVLQTKVESPVADKITEFTSENKITCISLQEDTKRYYPQNELAASVIGFVNSDGDGQYGIESYYNEELSGIPGKVISAKDAKGDEMPYRYSKLYEAQDGNSLYLTIDSNIQYYLEKNIQDMTKEFQLAEGACAIMMNVKTGAIYGMATTPSYDLNNPAEITDESKAKYIESITDEEKKSEELMNARAAQWKNKSVTDRYIPGSVFKVITSSAAIEENVIDVNTSTFNCTNTINVSGTDIHCWNYPYSSHGSQTFVQALTNSCNPAFIEIGQRLGIDKFAYYFEAFGLTETTGIDLPAEASSIYLDANKMGPVELASSSFGQTNKITPMEMITSYAAVINGGYLVTPYVVDKIVDGSGNVVSNHETVIKRQVISEDTSKTMRESLEAVVNNNGGSNAYIKGYHIGGKSGTSQKLDLYGDDDMRYVSSYCCFAPADDPEIVLLVVADEPMSGEYYGSVVAVPYARKILEEVLPYLGYYPEYTEEEIENMDKTVPSLEAKTISDAKKTLEEMSLNCEIVGSGTVIASQVPSAGSSISKDGTVILYTEGNTTQKMTEVPDFSGMNIEQVNEALTEAGLNCITTGASADNVTAIVSTQSVEAGETVAKGTVIELMFIIKDQSG
jgi:stage V sporulation protein D (sporulation-specific penicillin-binding protein)